MKERPSLLGHLWVSSLRRFYQADTEHSHQYLLPDGSLYLIIFVSAMLAS